jgi:flagellar basal-body rod protein FlgB
MQINGIFGLASQQATWLSVRQKTVAENIAQANIPGYIAKDTAPFKALVERGSSGLVETDPRHLSAPNDNAGVKVSQNKVALGMPGENVNVETELMKSIEVRNSYELNTAIVKSFHRMILAAAKA